VAEQQADQPGDRAIPSTPIPWVPIAWVAIAMCVAFYPMLERLIHQWSDDGDMGHGFFVPIVSGYLVWLRKAVD